MASYEGARYTVQLAHGPRVVRIGSPDSALRDAVSAAHTDRAALVGAENPFSEPASDADNARATAQLAAAIDAAGLARVPASGADVDGTWEEQGFCVFGASDALLDAWLIAFRQNAFVTIDAHGLAGLRLHPERRG
jgi:hypothetical protein